MGGSPRRLYFLRVCLSSFEIGSNRPQQQNRIFNASEMRQKRSRAIVERSLLHHPAEQWPVQKVTYRRYRRRTQRPELQQRAASQPPGDRGGPETRRTLGHLCADTCSTEAFKKACGIDFRSWRRGTVVTPSCLEVDFFSAALESDAP